MSSKFDQIGPRTAELAANEFLQKSPQTYDRIYVVNTQMPSFLLDLLNFCR